MTDDEIHSTIVRLFNQARSIKSRSISFESINDGRPLNVFFTLNKNKVVPIERIDNAHTYRIFKYMTMNINKHAPKTFSMSETYHDVYFPHGVISNEFDVHAVMLNQGYQRIIYCLTMGLTNEEKDIITRSSEKMEKSAKDQGMDISSITEIPSRNLKDVN